MTDMKPVASSAIHSIGYDPTTATSHVRFHSSDRVYQYSPVTPEEHSAFAASASLGKHFHAHLRGREVKE